MGAAQQNARVHLAGLIMANRNLPLILRANILQNNHSHAKDFIVPKRQKEPRQRFLFILYFKIHFDDVDFNERVNHDNNRWPGEQANKTNKLEADVEACK